MEEKKKPLSENSLFDPRSPYAAAKLFAHNLTKIYRDSYGMFAVNGICLTMSLRLEVKLCNKKNYKSCSED